MKTNEIMVTLYYHISTRPSADPHGRSEVDLRCIGIFRQILSLTGGGCADRGKLFQHGVTYFRSCSSRQLFDQLFQKGYKTRSILKKIQFVAVVACVVHA